MEWLTIILLYSSGIVEPLTSPPVNSTWKIEQNWTEYKPGIYRAVFTAPIDKINCTKEASVLAFPNMIFATQTIDLDGNIINRYGAKDFQWMRSFYGAPVIDCAELSGQTLRWEILSPTKYFARFKNWPSVQELNKSIHRDEFQFIAAFGALFLLAIYLLTVTYHTNVFGRGLALAGYCISMATFMLLAVSGTIGLSVSYWTSHHLVALTITGAAVSFSYFNYFSFFISKRVLAASLVSYGIALLFTLLAKTGDQIQAGLTLLFIPILAITWNALIREIFWPKSKEIYITLFGIIGLAGFVLSTSSDILYTNGIHDLGVTLPLGNVGFVLFLSLALHLEIKLTYQERDFLRKNLEAEVVRKTQQLTARTTELESTMTQLRHTQAELVQSAKLASIGTLSAGLAHEINNSINYVNGAIGPLEKILDDVVVESKKKESLQKLLQVMKEGLSFTVDIIKSLRNYTGLNQAKFGDVNLSEVITSVTTILKNRLRGKIAIETQIDPQLTIYGSVVGLNQVFMNLFSNSVDAIGERSGCIRVSATIHGDKVEIEFRDNGPGIPAEIVDRVFDPFFTTKEIGKGTGLGLYLVKGEIEKLGGRVEINANSTDGAVFRINLPHGNLQRKTA